VALASGALADQLGQPKRASTYYERAKRRAPNRASPAVAVAQARLSQGRVADALAELRTARRTHPAAARPVVELTRLLSLRGEIASALGVLSQGKGALDDAAKKELRSSRDFSALWGQTRFRSQLGDPLPSRWSGRRGVGERRIASTGPTAYAEAGELIE
jgi:tetratricopeptide (TPR) repeat protein